MCFPIFLFIWLKWGNGAHNFCAVQTHLGANWERIGHVCGFIFIDWNRILSRFLVHTEQKINTNTFNSQPWHKGKEEGKKINKKPSELFELRKRRQNQKNEEEEKNVCKQKTAKSIKPNEIEDDVAENYINK